MKIKVRPEGRDGVWIPEKESLIDFLVEYEYDVIHNIMPNSSLMLGADHDKKSVIDDVKLSERLAVLTGDSWKNNMRHALSVIKDNKLYMFDIGELSELDLDVCN